MSAFCAVSNTKVKQDKSLISYTKQERAQKLTIEKHNYFKIEILISKLYNCCCKFVSNVMKLIR